MNEKDVIVVRVLRVVIALRLFGVDLCVKFRDKEGGFDV